MYIPMVTLSFEILFRKITKSEAWNFIYYHTQTIIIFNFMTEFTEIDMCVKKNSNHINQWMRFFKDVKIKK